MRARVELLQLLGDELPLVLDVRGRGAVGRDQLLGHLAQGADPVHDAGQPVAVESTSVPAGRDQQGRGDHGPEYLVGRRQVEESKRGTRNAECGTVGRGSLQRPAVQFSGPPPLRTPRSEFRFMRDLILGTAGHIDHGKTSLVKALTGIDCDRLPEEKARGITIDIGFAHLDLGDYRLGIVDVPGHERFVKNMLAGATGIDLALLVVAADDSVMPQTREHLEILRLLGLRHGVIALTKADLVDERPAKSSSWKSASWCRARSSPTPRSSPRRRITGLGIDGAEGGPRRRLREGRAPRRGTSGSAWPIDRAFVVQGHGTVVTGSVTSGHASRSATSSTGSRGGEHGRAVRSLQNHDQPVEEVHRGQRAAINLAGVPHEDVRRGQELATPGYLVPSQGAHGPAALPGRGTAGRSSTGCRCGFTSARPRSWRTVSLLDCDHVDAGQWGLAQLFLDEPVDGRVGPAVRAARLVGRAHARRRAGAAAGRREDPPPAHRGARAGREAVDRATPAARAEAVAWFGGFRGLRRRRPRPRGRPRPRTQADRTASASCKRPGKLVELSSAGGRKVLLHADRWRELEDAVLDVLGQLHERAPADDHARPAEGAVARSTTSATTPWSRRSPTG